MARRTHQGNQATVAGWRFVTSPRGIVSAFNPQGQGVAFGNTPGNIIQQLPGSFWAGVQQRSDSFLASQERPGRTSWRAVRDAQLVRDSVQMTAGQRIQATNAELGPWLGRSTRSGWNLASTGWVLHQGGQLFGQNGPTAAAGRIGAQYAFGVNAFGTHGGGMMAAGFEGVSQLRQHTAMVEANASSVWMAKQVNPDLGFGDSMNNMLTVRSRALKDQTVAGIRRETLEGVRQSGVGGFIAAGAGIGAMAAGPLGAVAGAVIGAGAGLAASALPNLGADLDEMEVSLRNDPEARAEAQTRAFAGQHRGRLSAADISRRQRFYRQVEANRVANAKIADEYFQANGNRN